MNSHNTRPSHAYHKTPIAAGKSAARADVFNARLAVQTELRIDDDTDIGGDPYNSTGQHVILPQKNRS